MPINSTTHFIGGGKTASLFVKIVYELKTRRQKIFQGSSEEIQGHFPSPDPSLRHLVAPLGRGPVWACWHPVEPLIGVFAVKHHEPL